MATVLQYGSITPTLQITHILGTIVNPGVYVFKADLGAMTLGDSVELRFADQVTSGTIVCAYSSAYAHRQSMQMKTSPPVVITVGGHVSIRQTGGVARNFPFEIVSI